MGQTGEEGRKVYATAHSAHFQRFDQAHSHHVSAGFRVNDQTQPGEDQRFEFFSLFIVHGVSSFCKNGDDLRPHARSAWLAGESGAYWVTGWPCTMAWVTAVSNGILPTTGMPCSWQNASIWAAPAG
jgi:hypothetical protein